MNADKATSPASSVCIRFRGSGGVIWIGEKVGCRIAIPYQPSDPVPDLTVKTTGH
ncbi:MAG: hypothetical protein PF501_03485 [Salinisphaera sp.]|nr:hypothetical protein [Salinisphaera sp.]